MNAIRALFLFSLLFSTAARAADDAQDWDAFGHVLTLVQAAVRIGANPNPDQAMADLLAGRNHEANQAIASLFAGATAEMPAQYRDRVASIGRDIAGLALQNPATSAVRSDEHTSQLQSHVKLVCR